jgi:hypothetical protein
MNTHRQRPFVGIAALSLVTVLALSCRSERPAHSRLILEIEMRASAGTAAQLYWSTNLTFLEQQSVLLPMRAGEDFQRLRFPLPSRDSRWLRFDPTNGAGEVSIRSMEVLDSKGEVIAVLDPDRLHPYQQIASMARGDDATRLVTTPGATDPFLLISLAFLDRSFANRMALVMPVSLGLVTGAALALLIACIVVVGREGFGSASRNAAGPSRWRSALWLGVLFLVVFSASLFFMQQNPVTAPFWDQWDVEASWLYVPYHEGGLSWRSMFSHANEHRAFFTRLLALDLLIVNGQWDPRLQQVVNAGMHALTAVLLVTVLWIANQRRHLDLLVFIGALSFAPPFAWENILLAIQSAAYLLVLFSILSLWLVTMYPPGKGAWLLGWACAVCALLTFANGIIVPVAIMGVVAMKCLSARAGWRELAANAAAATFVLVSGIAMLSPPLSHHAPLRAASIADFAGALAHNLSWPWTAQPWSSLLLWLPMIAMLAGALWRRGRTSELERFAVGLAIWVVLNAAVLAYGRGAGAASPATRYMDYLSIGFVANAMALVAALRRVRAATVARGAVIAIMACWLVWVSAGVDRLVRQTLNDVPAWRQSFANHAVNIRRLMVSRDYTQFLPLAPLAQLPYPEPGRLTTLLQDNYIQQILPSGVRASLAVEPRISTNNAFTLQQPQRGVPHDPLGRAWWSLSDQGRKAVGRLESQPIACRPGTRLKLEVSGYLGWQHQYLALEELSSGREHVVQPSRLAREGWEPVVLRCPAEPFAVVAIDEAADSWFGFREPIEVGRASALVEWLIANSRAMLFGSLALAALALRWTGEKSSHVVSGASPHSG